jgi:tetratricopeptide (TPR) repeat protein
MKLNKLNFIFYFLVSTFYANEVRCSDFSFDEANKFYMAQQYDSAVIAYEQIIKGGSTSAEIFYNLGNSYYKTGAFTKAILNYERAKKIKPADEDILFNLAIANQKTIDKIESAPKVFYERWWEQYVASSNPDVRAILGIVFIWVAFIMGLAYIFTKKLAMKKFSFFFSFLLLIVGLFFIVVASRQNANAENHKEAIIVPDNCYVKSSPDEKSTNLFMLHTGTKVELNDELQGWRKIKIPNGNVGWVKVENIELI